MIKSNNSTIADLLAFLERTLSSQSVLAGIKDIKSTGSSTAGRHSDEEIFTREFLCPTITHYFRTEFVNNPPLTEQEITKGLGTEGFQNCPGFGFTPARKRPHFFRKSDIVRAEPPEEWRISSAKSLPKYQACPDFAITTPLPFRAIGEVKFFKGDSTEKALQELYNATRQSVFYLGAFNKEYDSAILIVADASPNHTFKKSLSELQADLLSRYGEDTGIHLAVICLQ